MPDLHVIELAYLFIGAVAGALLGYDRGWQARGRFDKDGEA